MKTIQPELQVPFSAVPGQQGTVRLVPGDSKEKENAKLGKFIFVSSDDRSLLYNVTMCHWNWMEQQHFGFSHNSTIRLKNMDSQVH